MENKASTAQCDLEQMLVDETAEPEALPLSLLKDITCNFSDDQVIGRGGSAVVYEGILGDRKVAVKRLSNNLMEDNEFHREIECLMRVKHKNVVRFLGYCADTQGSMEMFDGKFVMADVRQRLLCFEYIPNGSLDGYIIDAHREWETCYKIIKGICEGLQYLHDNNIIHLDLKPANILLDDGMVPKITDFGLSRRLDENQSRVLTKTISGTMGYLAPERYEGSGISRSGDLYSLGVIIIKILTGQKGHQAIDDVLESWIDRLDRSQQETLCEQIRVCYEIALECTDFNPEKRPASARNIIDRLHEMGSDQVNNTLVGSTSSLAVKKKPDENAIGILDVEIIGARNLVAMKIKEGRLAVTDPYCVVNYGEKWVRTGTRLATAAPQWNEHYSWDVLDVSTVVTVAVFDDFHLSSSGSGGNDARDEQMGKVRICLATLQTNRVYTDYYPLKVLTPSGVKKTGELHIAVCFTCKSWPKMLAMYGKPPLPNINYTNPISVDSIFTVEQDKSRLEAMEMVATRLSRAQPLLRREVVEYMLDFDSHVFSLRRSKANYYRITSILSGAGAAAKWFDGICKWKNPTSTILVHLLFLMLVCYADTKLILPMVFLCISMIAAWNYPRRPRKPLHLHIVDTMLPHADELNEELDPFLMSNPDDIVLMRYDRLRMIAGRLQTVLGDLAEQGERLQSLLRWRNPAATAIFTMLSLVVAIVLYLTPFRVVVMVMGLYFLRHPSFRRSRNRTNLLFNFYSRLSSKEDMIL